MSGEFDLVLTDVPDEKEIIVAKILAELLSINLQEGRKIVKSLPQKILDRASVQEAEFFQKELALVSATVSIRSTQSRENFEKTDILSFFIYYLSLGNVYKNIQELKNTQDKFKQISQQQIQSPLDRSKLNTLHQELESIKNQLESTKKQLESTDARIEALRSARLVHISILMGIGIVTAFVSNNLIVTSIIMAITFLIQAHIDKT
ncbi:MAG: ribosomal protein L7/L12 [Geitlerinemataceae cyanobacterium]